MDSKSFWEVLKCDESAWVKFPGLTWNKLLERRARSQIRSRRIADMAASLKEDISYYDYLIMPYIICIWFQAMFLQRSPPFYRVSAFECNSYVDHVTPEINVVNSVQIKNANELILWQMTSYSNINLRLFTDHFLYIPNKNGLHWMKSPIPSD